MHTFARSLTVLALAAALASCGGDDGTVSGDTSMPAEDVTPTDEVSQGEAEAVGTAYVGLTVEEAMAQAEVDARTFRIGSEDGEDYMLTEDYVLGRVTATVVDGVITEVVVEATPGPVTIR